MKKGAVDIAIMIGAIVIPTAALLGSLILTFGMIEGLTDGVVIATVFAHDIAALSSVAYSVPEDVTIFYNPPFDCRYIGNEPPLLCMDDKMAMSSPALISHDKFTRTFRHPKEEFKYFDYARIMVEIPDFRIPFEFSSYASLNEPSSRIPMSSVENNRLKISKTRSTMYNSLAVSHDDPLFELVRAVRYGCEGRILSGIISLQPQYYLCNEGNTLHLKKHIYLPHEVTPTYARDDEGHSPRSFVLNKDEGGYGDDITIESFDMRRFNDVSDCSVQINVDGTGCKSLNCGEIENIDVYRVGGCDTGTTYSRYDIVRMGMILEYRIEIFGDVVRLNLERLES